jgi:hypothetical protein
MVLAAFALPLSRTPVPVLGSWARLDPAVWPEELLPELRAPESGTRVFNDMQFGGFLILYAPNLKIFIDDRCELYGDRYLDEYVHALWDDPARLDRWADQYGFNLALVVTDTEAKRRERGHERDGALDVYLQNAPGWSVVRRTEAATLYRRQSGVRN